MLKFITEEYLKDSYRKEAFIEFELKADERLTPGGRQYLLDKGIKINSNLPTNNKYTNNKNTFDEKKKLKKEEIKTETVNIEEAKCCEDLKVKKILYKFKALETLFLSSASEMVSADIKIAQKIVDLGRRIKNIREYVEGTCDVEIINPKNSNEHIDSLEITDVYIHLKNSKQILSLYYLYCKLQEFKYEVSLDLKGQDNLDKILNGLYEIENSLSGIIKVEAGES